MLAALVSCCAGGTHKDETAERSKKGRRQRARRVVFVVLRRETLGVIIYDSDDRQRFTALNAGVLIAVETEHSCGANVICRRTDVQNEIPRKHVVAMLVSLRLRVDEDVRKWSGRVSHIRTRLKCVKEFPNSAVDGSHVVGTVDLAGLLLTIFGVNRRMIGFIVNEQQRHAANYLAILPVIDLAFDMQDPFEQILQYRAVLLDDENHRIAADRNSNRVGDRPPKVTIVCAVRQRTDGKLAAEQFADTNQASGTIEVSVLLGVTSNHAFVYAELSL